jgi:hypothetical protein
MLVKSTNTGTNAQILTAMLRWRHSLLLAPLNRALVWWPPLWVLSICTLVPVKRVCVCVCSLFLAPLNRALVWWPPLWVLSLLVLLVLKYKY